MKRIVKKYLNEAYKKNDNKENKARNIIINYNKSIKLKKLIIQLLEKPDVVENASDNTLDLMFHLSEELLDTDSIYAKRLKQYRMDYKKAGVKPFNDADFNELDNDDLIDDNPLHMNEGQ